MAGWMNQDLIRERKKCTFDIKELIYFIDQGEKNTKERKEIEESVLAVKELRDDVPAEFLSHKDKYENAVRKSLILYNIMKERFMGQSLDDMGPSNKFAIQFGILKDVSPLLLHSSMFLVTILGQSTDEQMAEWFPKAMNLEYIGTYAQTELGHGTFLRGLETTATYDLKTEEFIIHSPTLSSYKWWPGGLGHTANHCIVLASVFVKGENCGIHPFFVQIRDLETHRPLPGIKIGEIGPKMGFNTANNGFLGFNNYRIPRKNMMMKNAQVLKDGTFVKSKNDKLAYGTMVFVRVKIVTDVAYNLSMAATIATRYSAVRHQSKIKENQNEPQILDYVTQQHKIFIAIATSHALRSVGMWIWNKYLKFSKEMNEGNMDALPELHATACCLKVLSSKDGSKLIEECRQACGGHGYMVSSNLPHIYAYTVATVTYEGESTVLLLQTARYLMKAWKNVVDGKPSPIPYLANFSSNSSRRWENTPEGIIAGFQAVAAGKTKAAYDSVQKHVKAGKDYEDAWNLSSVLLCQASEAHGRAVICENFWSETLRIQGTVSPNLAVVLKQLAELYLFYWAIEKTGDLLLYTTISKSDTAVIQAKYEELLGLIRPNAVGLVDGFDIRDEILCSTLGAYDGKVYDRLMAEAMKSPLNQEPVNDSFHKYIKPTVMKSKI
ncbi:hypothetical protein O0L34_g14756 [Tuta absoluta]|nr:hypothetical protein O0L34_g14756 [Tuta absoluta]